MAAGRAKLKLAEGGREADRMKKGRIATLANQPLAAKYPFSPPHAKSSPVGAAAVGKCVQWQWASASSEQVRVRAAAVAGVNRNDGPHIDN